MYQAKWLRSIAFSISAPCPFNRGLLRVWAACPVQDDADSLGCTLMGGEL